MTETVCPLCDRSFEKVGIHWNRSSECTYPEFSPTQRELLEGLLLIGAGVSDEDDPNHHSVLRVGSTNESFLNWVRSQFPALGVDVWLSHSADAAADRLKELLGENPPEDVTANEVYEWKTRSLPALAEYRQRWYDMEGESVVPDDFSPSALSLTVTFALRGQLTTEHEGDEVVALFPVRGLRGDEDDWLSILQPFEPVVRGNSYPRVWLLDTHAFFEWLGSTTVCPTPPPGCDSWWPSEEAVLKTIHPDDVACPTCGNHYRELGQHWAYADCPYPELTDDQRAFVTGLLLVSGHIFTREGSRRPSLRFVTGRPAFARWVVDQLGILGCYVDKGTSDPPNAMALTRAAPTFNEFDEWYDETGQRVVPEAEIEFSQPLFRGLYGACGRCNDTYGDPRPRLHVTASSASDRFFESLLEPLNPEIKEVQRLRIVYLNDEQRVRELLGPPPTGLAERWPPEPIPESVADDPLATVFTSEETNS